MTADGIKRITANAEGTEIEYKKSQTGLARSVYETICTFLNRRGGHVVLGAPDGDPTKKQIKKLRKASSLYVAEELAAKLRERFAEMELEEWLSVDVLEPSVIFEAKDGKYGEDGSETLADFEGSAKTPSPSSFSNSLGDLKKNIEYIIGMERLSGNINTPTAQDIARILNVPVAEVEAAMREME